MPAKSLHGGLAASQWAQKGGRTADTREQPTNRPKPTTIKKKRGNTPKSDSSSANAASDFVGAVKSTNNSGKVRRCIDGKQNLPRTMTATPPGPKPSASPAVSAPEPRRPLPAAAALWSTVLFSKTPDKKEVGPVAQQHIYSPAAIRLALKREYFDWAEEMEETEMPRTLAPAAPQSPSPLIQKKLDDNVTSSQEQHAAAQEMARKAHRRALLIGLMPLIRKD
ncbi:hypothetical protein EG329_004384 [Mollisiaceae sp. DMI_Dod_QoI]|nr:hypothetical protein EG329_004384 [Helotiales sp. DMI_Dod_QoI]